MAGAKFERQETGLVNAVKLAVRKADGPVNLKFKNDVSLSAIIDCYKFGGRAASGSEPLTDIIFEDINGKKHNISCKGTESASVAGGGVSGIMELQPELLPSFLTEALRKYKQLGYKKGDAIPDMYGEIGTRAKVSLLEGSKKTGGPIDFLYTGPMSVTSRLDGTNLHLNGNLATPREFAKKTLYLRIRKRRVDQTFDPTSKDRNGLPSIMGKSPSKGDTNRRIVVAKSIPSDALKIRVNR